MIRQYENKEIYRELKICKILAIVCIIVTYLIIIPFTVIYIKFSIEGKIIFDISDITLLLYGYLGPLSLYGCINDLLNIKSNKIDVQRLNETKFKNDLTSIKITCILAALFGGIFGWVIFGILIHIYPLVKNEIYANPPQFIIDELKIKNERDIKTKKEKNLKNCSVLLEKSGVQFFVKYYKKIKILPLRDINLEENYAYAEKQERIIAVKKIIDMNLSECAFEIITQNYIDILGNEVIEQAKTLLADLKKEECING